MPFTVAIRLLAKLCNSMLAVFRQVANVDVFFVVGGGLFILSFFYVQKIHMPNPTLFMTHSGRLCLQKKCLGYIIIMVNILYVKRPVLSYMYVNFVSS